MHRYICAVKTFIHVNKNLKMKWRVIEEDTQYSPLASTYTHAHTCLQAFSCAYTCIHTERPKELFCVDSKQSSAVPPGFLNSLSGLPYSTLCDKISHSMAIFYIQWLVTSWHEIWVLGDGQSSILLALNIHVHIHHWHSHPVPTSSPTLSFRRLSHYFPSSCFLPWSALGYKMFSSIISLLLVSEQPNQ